MACSVMWLLIHWLGEHFIHDVTVAANCEKPIILGFQCEVIGNSNDLTIEHISPVLLLGACSLMVEDSKLLNEFTMSKA